MLLFQKGQTIDNRYTVVFPHKGMPYAGTCRSSLLPQWFVLPSSWKSHRRRINDGVLREQGLDVLGEGIGRIDAIEPVGNVAEMGVKFVGGNLSVGYPRTWQASWQAGCNNDIGIPKASVMGTDVSYDGKATKPCTHIFKLWDHEASTDGFLGSTVAHIAVKPGKCSHRSHLHRFPYRRHGRFVILAEMFLDVFVFRATQFFLQVSEIASKQIAVFCQSRFHKPESAMPFCKDAYHSGSDSDLNLLDGGKDENTQLFIKTIEAYYLRKSGTGLECVLLSVCFHQSPIACQTEIADGVKCVPGFFLILDKKPSLFQNVYLLLKREQLFSVSHNRINKKCPALVRYIHKGEKRQRALSSAKVRVLFETSKYFGEKVHK